MAFNGCCTGNDMSFSSEGLKGFESKLKIRAPKPSYEIISSQKDYKTISKIEYKPTKETFFSKNNIPKWLDISFYTIPKKDNKKMISLHIINKCLISKNPILNEPNLILYSHENDTDLLRLIPFLIDISIQLKCDIVSFDYWGFGCSSGKPKINTILSDGEDVLNFAISFLKYKIENILLFGNGIGSMTSIYLASRLNFLNCKGLILYMPIIGKKTIDIKVMKSIFCQALLIMEFENKDEISSNEIVKFCREIPSEKEWLPLRKKNNQTKNNSFYSNYEYNDSDDVYFRHRRKFILKLKDYIYPDKEILMRKRGKNSTVGGSTDSDTNRNLSIDIPEQQHEMSLRNEIGNKNTFNIHNFDEKNKIKINESDKVNINTKKKNYNDTEIEISNYEDY